MRFTNLLFAIPFVAQAYAAPVDVSPAHSGHIVEKSMSYPDVLDIVTELHTSIYAITDIDATSTEIDVEICLQAVITAFDQCGQALGIDISLGVDIEIDITKVIYDAPEHECQVISDLLTEVVVKVEHIVKSVDKSLCKLKIIADLLKQIDCAIGAILTCICKLLDGVFDLLHGLLSKLGLDCLLGVLCLLKL